MTDKTVGTAVAVPVVETRQVFSAHTMGRRIYAEGGDIVIADGALVHWYPGEVIDAAYAVRCATRASWAVGQSASPVASPAKSSGR